MKVLLQIALILSLPFIGYSQIENCSLVREGKFRIVSKETGTSIITRTGNSQIEEIKEKGCKAIFDVKWISDCVYELRLKKMISGDKEIAGKKDEVVTVKILQVNKRSYLTKITMTGETFELEQEIEILK